MPYGTWSCSTPANRIESRLDRTIARAPSRDVATHAAQRHATMPTIVRLTRVPPGYNLDALPKSTGYRINHSILEAALSCFEPRHNEFWNILTEIAPLLFFV